MQWYETLALGCLGGSVPDLLRIVEARHSEMPDYLRRGYFWISLILLMMIGGFVAFLLKPSGAIEILAVGYSAPELFTRLLSEKRQGVSIERSPNKVPVPPERPHAARDSGSEFLQKNRKPRVHNIPPELDDIRNASIRHPSAFDQLRAWWSR